MAREISTVGVVGLGTMGAGIAEVLARSGIEVIGVEVDDAGVERGRGHLRHSTERALAGGKLDEAGRDGLLGRIRYSTSLSDLSEVDLVIEAIPENLMSKAEVFSDLDKITRPDVVFVSNTSSLSITEISVHTARPGKVVGMHFFNPAPVLKLVEIVRTVVTEPDVVSDVVAFAERLGKVPVVIGDRAGFIANALLFGYLNHAVRMYEQRYAPREDLDSVPAREVSRVGVIGTGTMATGIAEVFAKRGYDVVLRARSMDKAQASVARVKKSLDKAVVKGKLSEQDAAAALGRIVPVTDFDALASVDLVIEAVAEELSVKQAVFAALDDVVRPGAILATTTSSLPVIECAAATSRPSDVVGLHFFNPAPVMKLVEVVSTIATAPDVVATASAVCAAVGKHAVHCGDRAGFIVNALLFPYLNDAVKMLEAHYAGAHDIDTAMKVGCGLPMGPFELLDVVGLDVSLAIERELFEEFREPGFAPAPLLEHLVTARRLGRKTGKSFRDYS